MPEVQAHAERMTAALGGATLVRFELLNFASLKTYDPPADAAKGMRLDRVDRRGKYLLLRFDGDLTHAVHLMQGGRLRLDPKVSKKPRLGLARWTFTGTASGVDEAWLLTEAGTERKAGVWAMRGDPLPQVPLDDLGPEADQLSRDELAERLSRPIPPAPRPAAGPGRAGRTGPDADQRDPVPGGAVAVRQRGQAHRRRADPAPHRPG